MVGSCKKRSLRHSCPRSYYREMKGCSMPFFRDNRKFAETLIRKFDPGYRQRWELYDGILKCLTGPKAGWLDAGCGENNAIEEFPCRITVGMDVYRHRNALYHTPTHLVLGSLDTIPFRDTSFTLVTLNTVVEHIREPAEVFKEIHRVLDHDGCMLIHTTKLLSPPVLLGKLLPQRLRRYFFSHVFGVYHSEIFKAYHKVNTPQALKSIKGFRVEKFYSVQDLNWSNRLVFLGLFAFHMITKIPVFSKFRSNLIVLLQKEQMDF